MMTSSLAMFRPFAHPISIALLCLSVTACERERPQQAIANVATTADDVPAAARLPNPPPVDDAACESKDPIADAAEKVVDAVVNISSVKALPTAMRQRSPLSSDPFFRRFFGPGLQQPPRRERLQRSQGSGVVVDANGILLTNHHVVDGAKEVKVSWRDGRELEADVVGSDKKTDLAVLKLKTVPDDLIALSFGDTDALRLGQTVLAVGNPFGVGQTVTMGIISAMGRQNVGIVDYEDFIQTDAAINPGNSGGALVNLKGQLIGINTAILTKSGGDSGIGFAIPADMVQHIMRDLLDDGAVARGQLGVLIQELSPDLAKQMGLDDGAKGVLIADFAPDSPAEKAGIELGDVVLELDGEPMRSVAELRNTVAQAGPNAKVTLKVWRDGAHNSIDVVLGALDADRKPNEAATASTTDGLRLAPTNSRIGQRLGVEREKGVVVVDLPDDSRLARAGLRRGDVIAQIQRKGVRDVEQAMKLLQDEGALLLWVRRGGGARFVAVPAVEGGGQK